MPTEGLYVDGLVNRSPAVDWTYVGGTPYLWDTDVDSIYTKSNTAESGDYSFANSAIGSGTINSVYIYFEAKADDINNDNFQVWIYDGSSWSDMGSLSCPQNTYSWINLNISGKLDTWGKIDLAELYVVYNKVGGADEVYIRRAYLYIDYSSGATPVLVQDAVPLNDAMGKERYLSVSDTIGASDGIPLTDKTFSLSDVSSLVDTILKQRNLAPVLDSVTLTDSMLKLRELQAIQDTINIGDGVSRDKTVLVINDVASLDDTIILLRSLGISDSLDLIDGIDVDYGATQIQVSDTVTLADGVFKERFFVVQDTLILTDSILKERTVSIMDTVALIDAPFIDKLALFISDTLNLSDDLLIGKTLLIEDYIGLSENVIREIEGAGWTGEIMEIYNPEKIAKVERSKIKKVSGIGTP